jgi:endonuclease III
MPGESKESRRERASRLLASLKRIYPDAHCELNYRNPLELLVATILSAQCTDKQVNLVTAKLFNLFPRAKNYAQAPLELLEESIERLGFFRNKARNIRECCRKLVEEHGGEVPRSMKELTQLAGVGRKTANVVLGNAFGVNDGIVVDTHVMRLSKRLGLSFHTNPEKIEQDLIALTPRGDWNMLSHLLIWHGRRCCSARRPECASCEIAADCLRIGVRRNKPPPASQVLA